MYELKKTYVNRNCNSVIAIMQIVHCAESQELVVAPSFPPSALKEFNAFQFICGVEKKHNIPGLEEGFPTLFLFFLFFFPTFRIRQKDAK